MRVKPFTLYAMGALAVLVASITLLGSITTSAATPAQPDAPKPALTVTAVSTELRSWPRIIEANGTIAAWDEASIGTTVGGLRVVEVHANVGDTVKRGQILVRFDTDALRMEEAELTANVVQARAQLLRADADNQRAQTLLATGAVSEQDALQYATQAKASLGQLEASDARLRAKQVQLRQSEVLAPDRGVISARTVSVGAVAPAGQELFRLIRQQRLEWRGEIGGSQIAEMAVGQTIVLTLPTGSLATAHVRSVAPSLNAQTRLGTVYADIAPGSPAVAGMYVSARIELPASPARVVPAMSVLIRDGHNLVATLNDGPNGSTAVLQQVTVGRRRGNEIEITMGLKGNERVIARGAGFIGDGDLVKVVPVSAFPATKKD